MMLRLSYLLFLVSGSIHVVIGVLTPVFHGRTPISMVIMSPRTDRAFFGVEPEELLATDTSLRSLRTVVLMMLAGGLVGWGLLEIGLAWFGVRKGEAWPLGTMTVAGLAVLPFWYLAFRPYWRAGIALSVADMPPFIWIPTILFLPAAVLGWLGIRTG